MTFLRLTDEFFHERLVERLDDSVNQFSNGRNRSNRFLKFPIGDDPVAFVHDLFQSETVCGYIPDSALSSA